jgi:hypothetical protein
MKQQNAGSNRKYKMNTIMDTRAQKNLTQGKSWKDYIIIPHNSWWKPVFDIIILLLVGYSCVTSMLYAAFQSPSNTHILLFDEIVEYLFRLDLVFNFLQSYVDQDTYEEVTDLKKISRQYVFKGWFFVDFMSVFPF